MTQYPDTIVITTKDTATQDEDGNWVGGNRYDYTFKCRAEANVAAKRIIGADGVYIDYRLLCYAPTEGLVEVLMTTEDGDVLTTEAGDPIVIGDLVTSLQNSTDSEYVLTSANGSIYSGMVKMSFKGQLNTRLWL